MSEESFNLVELEGLKDEDIPQELLDELDRELARNAEANRLVKEKEQEAIAARERAEKSRNLMQEVMGKYDQIRNKVDTTKAVLEASAKQAERRQKLQEDINDLKERAEKAAEEYMQKQVIKELEEAGMGRAGTSIAGSTQTKRNRDYAQTVQRLQDKLKQRKQQAAAANEEAKKADTEEVEDDNNQKSPLPVAELPPPTKEEEVSMAIRAMEFKCAIVQERLDEIKMNEELLATREAQLVAVKRQKEAMLAEEQAKRKEEEAKEMRKKVESMMRLLSERKNKLKVTENAIEKKGNVVNKVEKILHSKERKATYTEKKRVERLMFAKVQREKKLEEENKGEQEEASEEVQGEQEEATEELKGEQETPAEVEGEQQEKTSA